MIRLISVKCPECGAALEFEEGRSTAFCSYCGAKILLHNENEHIFRTIDEAGIKQAENDRAYMMKELEMEEREDKHHRTLTAVWLICTILLFTVGIIMVTTDPTKDSDGPGYMLITLGMLAGLLGFLMISDDKNKKKKKRNRPGYVKVPDHAVDFEKQHYTAVGAALRAGGFSNIRTINLGDLRLGILKRNGSVESVTIDGENIAPDEWYRREARVIISYHGFAE